MFPLAGQTAGPNGPTFFVNTHGGEKYLINNSLKKLAIQLTHLLMYAKPLSIIANKIWLLYLFNMFVSLLTE